MVFNEKYRIGLEDCGADCLATNKAILTIIEDVAGLHSSSVGLGLGEISENNYAWVVLYWKVKVINRPHYNQVVDVYTWSTNADKLFADRDFEITDDSGQIMAIATSRWIYMDLSRRRPARITEELMGKYQSEPQKHVFEDIISKSAIPDTEYVEIPYTVLRRDVDYLGHMHNISYLDAAYDVMPDDIYEKADYNWFAIEYKKELMRSDKVMAHFYKLDKGCIITFNTDKINAVITLKNED